MLNYLLCNLAAKPLWPASKQADMDMHRHLKIRCSNANITNRCFVCIAGVCIADVCIAGVVACDWLLLTPKQADMVLHALPQRSRCSDANRTKLIICVHCWCFACDILWFTPTKEGVVCRACPLAVTGHLTDDVSLCCQNFKSTTTAASLCTGASKTKPTTWPSAAQ